MSDDYSYENENKLKSMYEAAEAFFEDETREDGIWYQQTMIHAAVSQAESLARIATALERLIGMAETSSEHDTLIDLYRGAGPA